MDVHEVIEKIANGERRTPVRVYLKAEHPLEFPDATVFGLHDMIVFGDWENIKKILSAHESEIREIIVETDCRNSAVPLLDVKDIHARIEPCASIREHVEIGEKAVIMMGAILNIGCVIGNESMVDMGAVIGGRAVIGDRVHIGANAVIAGVIEPVSAQPVQIDDDVLIGANAVVLEGIHIHSGAVVAAGAVVTKDVCEDCIVAGIPARIIKRRNQTKEEKIAINKQLR